MIHELIDYMGITGENVFQCTCGERLMPDCDMSRVSVAEEWSRHVAEVHRRAWAYGSGPKTLAGDDDL